MQIADDPYAPITYEEYEKWFFSMESEPLPLEHQLVKPPPGARFTPQDVEEIIASARARNAEGGSQQIQKGVQGDTTAANEKSGEKLDSEESGSVTSASEKSDCKKSKTVEDTHTGGVEGGGESREQIERD